MNSRASVSAAGPERRRHRSVSRNLTPSCEASRLHGSASVHLLVGSLPACAGIGPRAYPRRGRRPGDRVETRRRREDKARRDGPLAAQRGAGLASWPRRAAAASPSARTVAVAAPSPTPAARSRSAGLRPVAWLASAARDAPAIELNRPGASCSTGLVLGQRGLGRVVRLEAACRPAARAPAAHPFRPGARSRRSGSPTSRSEAIARLRPAMPLRDRASCLLLGNSRSRRQRRTGRGVAGAIEGHEAERSRASRAAAALEDSTGERPVTPGAWCAPARELLADMLLETHHPAEALASTRPCCTTPPGTIQLASRGRRAAEARASDPPKPGATASELLAVAKGRRRRPSELHGRAPAWQLQARPSTASERPVSGLTSRRLRRSLRSSLGVALS